MITVTELAAQLSHQVGRQIPHDGHMLVGLDPLTRAVCFRAAEHGYSVGAAHRMETETTHALSPGPATSSVEVIDTATPARADTSRVHEILTADGIGGELRMPLTAAGVTYGVLVLVREHNGAPFSADEAGHAARLATPFARALREFVTSRALHPANHGRPPCVVIVDSEDRIRATTPSAQAWLDEVASHNTDSRIDERGWRCGSLWHLTHLARQGARPALSRVPTPHGWIVLHAQPLDSPGTGEVALTINAATVDLLLPAVAAWYALTSRETTVIEEILTGLPIKQIARRLGLSEFTVKDHLKAIYGKTGVRSRDELAAAL